MKPDKRELAGIIMSCFLQVRCTPVPNALPRLVDDPLAVCVQVGILSGTLVAFVWTPLINAIK